MVEKKEPTQRAQSPELAAGTGFTFEDAVGAYFLSALLDEGYAPGIENRTVSRVALQQRNFKQPLDDVIVDFRDQHGEPARLSLQVKRELIVSAAASNEDFREVIRDCWSTYKKADFRTDIDRFGAAAGEIAKDKARDLIFLCEMARASTTTSHFMERFADGGNASAAVRVIKADIETLLTSIEGHAPSNAEMHGFLAHFVLEKFDFLHGGAIDPPEIMTRLRNELAVDEGNQAPLLWTALRQTVRDFAGKSGEFDRPRLVQTLAPLFRLRAAPSLRGDLEKITNLTHTWLADIANDVGGAHLDRMALSGKLADLLAVSRFVQIKGLPGSGKSVVLRQRLEADLARGPVLFLKSDRLDGKGWSSFAASNGLSSVPLTNLLVDIGATGSNTLFIDGIDRIEKEHQSIVLDVLRAILRSPLLDDWKIVVSLRDTGIEPLRNWLGNVMGAISVVTLDVGALDDHEAEGLAKAKPHLRSLLFGAPPVREIVRRPFFAKILDQTGSGGFQPQSEVDLLENWWVRGGYNADGQDALDRQRALIEIGAAQARHLSQPVPFRQLSPSTTALVESLAADGLVRHVRRGHTVRFAHDILFEWSFFHVLSDKGEDWLAEIRECGEPPAVARVVELLAQYEYREGQSWPKTLQQVAGSKMRSQWTRAWLLGPIAASSFSTNEGQFADAAMADNFHFLQKALVWFQAEKTTPNPNILAGNLPQDQRIRFADLLSWPSDFSNWGRFLFFLIARLDTISATLYPNVVSVFEVWQNAFSGLSNPISAAIVQQCGAWLREIDKRSERTTLDESSRWEALSELGNFRKSLINIILRSAVSVPEATEEYLTRVISLERMRDERFTEVAPFSPILATTHPQLLAELTLKHLKEELPDDKVARERKETEDFIQRREKARAKPASERTEREKAMLKGGGFSHFGYHQFSSHDFTRLCIDHDTHNFWPASPLREPFHSLFKSAPEQAIKLFNDLCNHAIAAWRQLHRHVREYGSPRPGTPIPLVIEFPWGKQEFWGGEREYLWHRAMGGPEALECGFMALEEWCFSELERGRPVDELIRQIIEGNQSIAILGVAVLLALQTTQESETVFPLITAQRLWSADQSRLMQDLSASTALLMGFTKKADQPHIDAINALNARPVRKQQLRWLVPNYVLSPEFGERTRAAILAFKDNLPYEYEEHRNHPSGQEYFTKQAIEYAELADIANYKARKAPDKEDLIEVMHVSPSASLPENVAKAERAALSLQQSNLWAWASKVFENGRVDDPARLLEAIELAHKLDSPSLYAQANNDDDINMKRGAVAALAAVVLEFRGNRTDAELTWARDLLKRAIAAPDTRGPMWSSQSVIPWHPSIFAARGLGADLRNKTSDGSAAISLLGLVSHPLEIVSLAALDQTARLWNIDPKLEWAALYLAFTLCHIEPPPDGESRGPGDPIHTPSHSQEALNDAVQYYREQTGWPELPLPPPPWIKVEDRPKPGQGYSHEFERDDLEEPDKAWIEPRTHWYSQYAGKVLERIPYEEIITGEASEPLLIFIARVLEWTRTKNSPPWVKKGRRDRESSRLFEWNHELGSTLGRLSGLLPMSEVKWRFLEPVLAVEGETCWALLAPFVSNYICRYVYDAKTVPDSAPEILGLCLDRLLESPSFKRGSYNGGEFHGFGEPRLLELLMFVSIEQIAPGAARFANGDWSEIKLILPIVDRFVRAGGWSGTVMHHFLTLCERSKDVYPADLFADQILEVIGTGSEPLKGWHGTFIPARIAGLVQHFANRETPMASLLAQKLLRVLDLLVDMGDRRSAALQLSESFREVRIA